MGLMKNILNYYRDNGGIQLLRKCSSTILKRVYRSTSNKARNIYWGIRGTQHFSISGTTAEFNSTRSGGGDVIRSHFESENQVLEKFVGDLRSDDVVFDVGGHLGLYTCFAANTVVEGQVVSFEPFPPNLVRMLGNVQKNNRSNVKIISGALGNDSGIVPIQSPTLTEDYGSPAIEMSETTTLNVPSLTGDQIVNSGAIPEPNVVKIDVEGAEGLVIDGLEETLKSGECRQIFCELHPPASHRSDVTDFGYTVSDVREKIQSLGFRIKMTHERGTDTHIVAVSDYEGK